MTLFADPRNPARRTVLIGCAAALATVVSGGIGARAESASDVTGTASVQSDPTLPHPAEEFVRSIADDLLAIARSSDDGDTKHAKFQALLIAHAHIPTIAEFSLGPFASTLTDDQREPYYALVSSYISRIFVTHSANLRGRSVDVTGTNVRSEREALVSSKVWFESGRALPVIWRVIRTENGFKVFDVSVNGIWLTIQQRSEFVSVIRKNNGDVQALLAFLDRND